MENSIAHPVQESFYATESVLKKVRRLNMKLRDNDIMEDEDCNKTPYGIRNQATSTLGNLRQLGVEIDELSVLIFGKTTDNL